MRPSKQPTEYQDGTMTEQDEGPVIDPMQSEDLIQHGLEPLRQDEQGRKLCTAKSKSTGQLCKSPAMRGQRVCRMHGGASKQARAKAKLRLAELVDPAIATLAKEMVDKENKSADKQRAANSILDRAGFGRVTHVESEDAKAMLYARLQALRKGRDPEEVTDETD